MRAKKFGGDKVSPRTGRPKVDNPKEQRFTIRLDKTTGDRLDKYCLTVQKRRAEVIREAILSFLDKQK